MQITNVLVSFLLAASVSAKGGKNGTESVKSQCQSIAKLTSESELATNDTKLAAKFDNNQTKIDAFKAKAADSTTKLTTLSSNSTLMTECSVIAAHEDAVDACDSMADWEKTVATAANTTKLDAKFDGNTTKIDAFTAKASKAATKLAAMQTNETMLAFCSVQATASDCKTMASLQKSVAKASNTTALETKFKGNATKIAKAQAEATKDQTKLDTLMANSTLMSACSALTQAGTLNGEASTTTAASPAGRVEAASGLIGAIVLALTASMVML